METHRQQWFLSPARDALHPPRTLTVKITLYMASELFTSRIMSQNKLIFFTTKPVSSFVYSTIDCNTKQNKTKI